MQGMAIRFNETDLRAMGRPAGGVRGIELTEHNEPDEKSPGMDEVVSMIVIPQGDAGDVCMVLTACVNGFGKRTPVDAYRLIKRGGKGVINIKTNDRNGNVVGMAAVCDTDELMLITEKGILIRTRVEEIRETGRNAAGVKLIRVDEGDRLVAMAKVDAEEVDPVDKAAAPQGGEGSAQPDAQKPEAAAGDTPASAGTPPTDGEPQVSASIPEVLMAVKLAPEDERDVRELLEAGRYPGEDTVVQAALAALKLEDVVVPDIAGGVPWTAEALRAAVSVGAEQ